MLIPVTPLTCVLGYFAIGTALSWALVDGRERMVEHIFAEGEHIREDCEAGVRMAFILVWPLMTLWTFFGD